jgi:hypothetical protein
MVVALRFLLAGIATTFWLGCAGPSVVTDWDPSISWPMLGRYAWLPDPAEMAGDPRLHNTLVDGRVRRAVDRQLAAAGYERVFEKQPDFFVTYYLGLDTQISVRMVANSFGYQRGGWSERHRTETRIREHEVGTLLIDFLDRERALIWRGSTSSRVRSNLTPTRRDERIATAVEAILAEFPPTRDCPACSR